MTQVQLAARLKVTRQTINDLERGEAAGKITLESLRRLAAALECKVVYAVVPDKPLAEMRRDRARAKAEKQLKRVSRSMKLEAQGVSDREAKRQLARLVEQNLAESPRKLWD